MLIEGLLLRKSCVRLVSPLRTFSMYAEVGPAHAGR